MEGNPSYTPPSITFAGKYWSSGDLTGMAVGWREVLQDRFPHPSGPVAMVMANHPESVALFFALSCLSIPIILLHPDPRTWRTSPPLPIGTSLLLPPAFRKLASAGVQVGLEAAVLPDPMVVSHGSEDPSPFLAAPGVVFFTSGSTGLPKPVYWTINRILVEISAIVDVHHLPPGSGVLGSLPLAAVAGVKRGLMLATVLGSHVGLLEHFDHRSFLSLLASEAYHYWAATPLMASILARCPLAGLPPPAPSIVDVGAGELSKAVFRAFLERFGIPLRPTYGSTETGILTADTAPPFQVRPEASGRPLPGIQVRIGDDPQNPFLRGRVGRIWFTSPWSMEGYGYPPHLEPRQHHDGWRPTGDLGVLDEAGYLTLMGRVDDCFKSVTGHLINPSEIASVLINYPGVTDAAVVPLGDPTGPVIGALVEGGETLELADLRSHTARFLPAWSQPRVLEMTRELPRIPGGKTDRRACIAILEKSFLQGRVQ